MHIAKSMFKFEVIVLNRHQHGNTPCIRVCQLLLSKYLPVFCTQAVRGSETVQFYNNGAY